MINIVTFVLLMTSIISGRKKKNNFWTFWMITRFFQFENFFFVERGSWRVNNQIILVAVIIWLIFIVYECRVSVIFCFFFKREILNNSSAGHREGKLKETKNDAISAAINNKTKKIMIGNKTNHKSLKTKQGWFKFLFRLVGRSVYPISSTINLQETTAATARTIVINHYKFSFFSCFDSINDKKVYKLLF